MAKFSRALWNELHNLSAQEIETIKRFEADSKGPVFSGVAELLRKRGYIDESIVILDEGLRSFPQYHSARAALARDYYFKGMMPEALQHIEVVIQRTPENLMAQRLRLKLALIFNQRQEAAARLEILKEISADDEFTRIARDLIAQNEWQLIRRYVLTELKKLGIRSDWANEDESQSIGHEPQNSTAFNSAPQFMPPAPPLPRMQMRSGVEILNEDLASQRIGLSEVFSAPDRDTATAQITPSEVSNFESNLSPAWQVPSEDSLSLTPKSAAPERALGNYQTTQPSYSNAPAGPRAPVVSKQSYEAHQPEREDLIDASFLDDLHLPDAFSPGATLSAVRGDPDRYLLLRGFKMMASAGLYAHDTDETPTRGLESTTLAEIYVTQGMFMKALEIYERLSATAPLNEQLTGRLAWVRDQAKAQLAQRSKADANEVAAAQAAAASASAKVRKLRYLETLLDKLEGRGSRGNEISKEKSP